MKRKFRDTLRSKTPVAQRNELLLMVLCHNIVYLIHEIEESGAVAFFPSLFDSPRPKNFPTAQERLDWSR